MTKDIQPRDRRLDRRRGGLTEAADRRIAHRLPQLGKQRQPRGSRAGVPEALEQGACGILVPPDDPGALRAGIRRLLDQADLAAQFGSRAREHAQRAYSIAAIGDVVEREYRAVLHEAR